MPYVQTTYLFRCFLVSVVALYEILTGKRFRVGTTHFVDKQNGDSQGDGTAASPLLNLDYCGLYLLLMVKSWRNMRLLQRRYWMVWQRLMKACIFQQQMAA